MNVFGMVFKNTGFLFVSDVISRLLSFALFLAIARVLGQEGLGDYSFIFAFVGLFVVLNDIGLSTLFVREASRNLSRSSYFFSNVLTMKVFFSILAAAITAIAINFTNSSMEVTLSVYVAALAMLFLSIGDLLLSVFQAHQRMFYIGLARALQMALIVSVGIAALLMGYGVLGLALAFLTSYFFIFALSAMVVARLVPFRFGFDFVFQKKFIVSALPFWFTGVFLAIYFRIDTVMIGVMRGAAETGLYNASYRLLDALYFIPAAVIGAVFPAMSQLHVTGKAVLQRLYKKAFYYLLVIALPMAMGATLVAERLLHFMYGSEFIGAAIALQILIWAEAAIFLSSLTGHLMNATNRQLVFTFATAAAMALNVLLNLYFIRVWGYVGAAVTTLITEFFVLAVLFYFARKHGFVFSVFKLAVKPLAAALAMAAVILALLQLHVIIVVGAAAAVYFALLLLMRGIESEEINLLKGFFRRS